ncbi:centrosomal protein of 164 kDa isoform X2 [Lepisosteus oculatus]|uniref:centrosomal protein of 164 kDa isoform X2 n=1 Tax=Lepisosteus oculatus TaxID=7918 RepID=UPI003715CC74
MAACLKNEDLMSDVEPLPTSAPPSPRLSFSSSSPSRRGLPPASLSPSLARSWPPSPSPSLTASREVTARLYASLQDSRALEGRGHDPALTPAAHSDRPRPRQVTFRLSSPELHEDEDTPSNIPSTTSANHRAWRKDTPLPSTNEGDWGSDESQSLASQGGRRKGTSLCFDHQRPAPGTGGKLGGSTPTTAHLASSLSPFSPCPSPEAALPGRASPVGGGAARHAPGGLAEELSQSLQAGLENSATAPVAVNGTRHIMDMESVRSHLRAILGTSGDPSSQGALAPGASERWEEDSFESDSTANLLRVHPLAEVSPPLSASGLEELFPRYSRLRLDGAAVSSETQMLRESLERERTRRKHREQQIQTLQNKTLELQQQLALAVSADRKKDIMIEQLDKTLAKVVEGWRKHEADKSDTARRLQEEKETAERAQAEQQEMLSRFEESLAQAAETLDREQRQAEELQATNQRLEQQVGELSRRLEEVARRCQALEEQRDEATRAREAAHASLDQHRASWDRRERELEDRLARQEAEFMAQLDNEKASREREAQRAQDTQRVLASVQEEVQRAERELEEAQRARDSAAMDRALAEARFEAERTKMEVELKVSVEQQVTERLKQIQEENTKATAALRETHRKQMLEASTQHEKELSAQLAQFRTELQEREEKLRKLTEDYENKLSQKQEEVLRVEAARRKLEIQRTELVSRLQGLLRSHWAEALKLLAAQSTPHSQGEESRSDPAQLLSSESWLWDRLDLQPGRPLGEAEVQELKRSQSAEKTGPRSALLAASSDRTGAISWERETVGFPKAIPLHATVQLSLPTPREGQRCGGVAPDSAGGHISKAAPPTAGLLHTSQDLSFLLSHSLANQSFHPLSSTNQSLHPLSPTNQSLQPLATTNQSFHTLSPTNQSFRPLEPHLDDTVHTALGSCDLEELVEQPLGEDSGYSAERRREGHSGHRSLQELSGYSTGSLGESSQNNTDLLKQGHKTGREGHSGYSTAREREGHSGYSTAREREGHSGHSTAREREGHSGHSTAREREGHSGFRFEQRQSAHSPGSLGKNSSRTTQMWTQGHSGTSTAREREGHSGFRFEQGQSAHSPGSLGRNTSRTTQMWTQGHSGTSTAREREGESGFRIKQQLSGHSSGTEGLQRARAGGGKEGLGGCSSVLTPQGPPGVGGPSLELDEVHPLLEWDREGRQSELQYYIQLLLDRTPGEPVDSVMPAPGQRETSTAEESPSRQTGPVDGILSPQQIGQLSRLLTQCHSQPSRGAPSLEDLLTYLRSVDSARCSQGEGGSVCLPAARRSHSLQSSQGVMKEAPPARRGPSARPVGGDRSQSKQVRKAVAQSKMGQPTRGTVWR